MSIHDQIRKKLHNRIGIMPDLKRRDPSVMKWEIHQMIRKLEEIRQLAEPRLIMGGIRYGSDWDHKGLMDYIQVKFDLYRETGNFEMLVDVFNLIAVEGENKTHPLYHFNPVDREE